MWSYYANNHRGYFLGYDKDLILNELDKQYKGICFIGKVSYKKSRPHYRITKTLGPMNQILFYVNCLFTKYNEWSHENEYRITIIDSNKSRDYSINTQVMEWYVGCESNPTKVPLSFTKMVKDVEDYSLRKGE